MNLEKKRRKEKQQIIKKKQNAINKRTLNISHIIEYKISNLNCL